MNRLSLAQKLLLPPRLKALFLLLVLLATCLSLPTPPVTAAVPPQSEDYIHLTVPQAPGGNVLALVQAPSDPNVLYNMVQGINGRRFFRSLDGGASWQERYLFSYGVSQNFTKLAVDPASPEIVYAYGELQNPFQQSLDGGATWEWGGVRGEVLAAVSSNYLYAAGGVGWCDDYSGKNYNISRSDDDGQTWQSTPLGCLTEIQNIAVLPTQPDLVYLFAHKSGENGDTLLKSVDAGQTWGEVALMFHYAYGGDLLIDPADPDRLYASSYDWVYGSQDGGATWQKISTLTMGMHHRLALSGGRLYAMQVTENRVPVFRTDDGGATWWASVDLLPAGAGALLADPSQPGRIWAGLVNYGVYLSEDGGGSWSERNDGILSTTTINSLSVPASDPNVVYAAVRWPYAGVYRSNDGGETWGPRMLGFEDFNLSLTPAFRSLAADGPAAGSFSAPTLEIHKILVHPQHPEIAWAATSYGVYETVNGLDWQLKLGDRDAVDLAVSAANPDHPYAVLQDDYSKTDYGYRYCYPVLCHWSYGTLFANNLISLDAIAADPLKPGRMLVAGVTYTASGKAVGIYQRPDNASSWQPLGQIDVDATPSGLVIAPQNPRYVVAYLRNDQLIQSWLFCSQDGGATWEDCTPAAPPMGSPPVIDELGTAYAGTNAGVYRRLPTQTAWEPFWLDLLLMRAIHAIAYSPGPAPKLLAATEHVLWRLDLPPIQRTWLPVVGRAAP